MHIKSEEFFHLPRCGRLPVSCHRLAQRSRLICHGWVNDGIPSGNGMDHTKSHVLSAHQEPWRGKQSVPESTLLSYQMASREMLSCSLHMPQYSLLPMFATDGHSAVLFHICP